MWLSSQARQPSPHCSPRLTHRPFQPILPLSILVEAPMTERKSNVCEQNRDKKLSVWHNITILGRKQAWPYDTNLPHIIIKSKYSKNFYLHQSFPLPKIKNKKLTEKANLYHRKFSATQIRARPASPAMPNTLASKIKRQVRLCNKRVGWTVWWTRIAARWNPIDEENRTKNIVKPFDANNCNNRGE